MMVQPVTVVLDGRLVEASQTAQNVAGVVVAPLDPYLRRVADRISVDLAHGTITLSRGATSISLRLGDRRARTAEGSVVLPIAPYVREGEPYVPLAAVVRALGEAVAYDPQARLVSISSAALDPVATMTPYIPDPNAPTPGPAFTPAPLPTPRPVVTGSPYPRRTPIEAGNGAGPLR
jgi:hypothetical protein